MNSKDLQKNADKSFIKPRLIRATGLALAILKSKLYKTRIPISVSIHCTNRCNLRCAYCYSNVDGRYDLHVKEFSTKELLAIINELHSMGTRWLIFVGGEPLVRDDIATLLEHAQRKGMLTELVTNGILLQDNHPVLKYVDSVCISIDGDERTNDSLRGPGSFKKAVAAIEVCKRMNVPVRAHAVLTIKSLDSVDRLSTLCKELGISFGYSYPVSSGGRLHPSCQLDKTYAKKFWRKLLSMKKSGHPIYSSTSSLRRMADWPIPYSRRIPGPREWPKLSKVKYKPCLMGERYFTIDSEGNATACVCVDPRSGPDIRKVGIKQAWEELGRRDCESCGHMQYHETSAYLDLEPEVMAEALKYIILRK